MSKINELNRRQFLVQNAALATAASLPLASCASLSTAAQDSSPDVARAATAATATTMRTRVIPGTRESIPVMGLGAPDLFYKTPPEGNALPKALLQALVDTGGRLIDTPAFFRPDPPTIGPLIQEMHLEQALFLIGKITVSGKQAGIEHLERTAANLNKRPMDVMLVHNMRELDVHWPTLRDWKAAGKVRYVGVSLTRETDYSRLLKFMKDERPDFVMTGYSITQQGPAERVTPYAEDAGIAIVGAEPFKAKDDGAFFSVVADKPLPEWVKEFGCESWAQFSLKWILSDPAVVAVVTETSSVKHLVDNLRAGYGGLPDKATRRKMSDLLLSYM